MLGAASRSFANIMIIFKGKCNILIHYRFLLIGNVRKSYNTQIVYTNTHFHEFSTSLSI